MSMLRSTPGARSSGPIWSKKMNGPTMRRFANGSTRPTSMPPPRLRRRCSITSIMTSACATWYRRVKQLLFPQVGDAAASGMLLQDFGQLGNMLEPRPVALPFGGYSQPGHHVGTGGNHALDGDFVGLDRNTARGIGHHRDIPAFAQRLDCRQGNAYLGPEPCNNQLLAARRLDGVHDLLIFPGIDESPVDHLLAGEHVGDLGEDHTASFSDDAGQDSWHAERFGGLGQGGRIVDDCLRIVAVQVRELVWLVVDQNKYGIFGTKKRIKAVTKSHDISLNGVVLLSRSLSDLAAVNVQDGAGDVLRGGAGEKRDCGCHVFGFAKTTERRERTLPVGEFAIGGVRLGVRRSRLYQVYRDVSRPKFAREPPGK